MNKPLTRRSFLRASLGAAAVILAACQPQVVEKIVKETVEVEKEKIVEKEVTTVVEKEKIVEKEVEKVVTAVPVVGEAPNIWMIAYDYVHGNEQKTEEVRQFIYDQTGIWVNSYIMPSGVAEEKLNLLLASGTQPLDLFEGSWIDFKGMILPLNDLLDQYGANILKGNKEVNWATMKDWEGTVWGYPRLGMMGHTHWLYFRIDWLDETGMEMPDTWEEMEEALTAFKGTHPESVVATNSLGDLEMNTLGAFTEYGASNWLDSADGMVKPRYLQPGYIDWLTQMNQWWEKGWFQLETFANPDFRAMLQTLTIGLWAGWYSRIAMWWADIKYNAGYEKEDYNCPFILTGVKGKAKTINAGSNSAYMIPRKSKHPDAVIRFIDWIYDGLPDDPTNLFTVQDGLEGDTWKYVDKEKKIKQSLLPTGTPLEERYGGEYWNAKGMGTEPIGTQWKTLDSEGQEPVTVHAGEWIYKHLEDYDSGKIPFDYDVPYDRTAIRDRFPGLADLDRLVSEEVIKFITGIRPLADWDAFISQAEGAGLQQWSELFTEQYRMYHPA